jgi:hypothetical protein
MIEVVKNNKDLLLKYSEFTYFLEDEFGTTDMDKIIDEQNIDFKDIVDRFELTDAYYEFTENFEPMMCHVHITQYSPSDKELELLERHCSAVVWLELDGVFQGIGLTGVGIDFSDSLELAYYIIDRESPIRATQQLTIGNKEWGVVLKMREAIENKKYFDIEKELR